MNSSEQSPERRIMVNRGKGKGGEKVTNNGSFVTQHLAFNLAATLGRIVPLNSMNAYKDKLTGVS